VSLRISGVGEFRFSTPSAPPSTYTFKLTGRLEISTLRTDGLLPCVALGVGRAEPSFASLPVIMFPWFIHRKHRVSCPGSIGPYLTGPKYRSSQLSDSLIISLRGTSCPVS
jgi:hypothetical protein